MSMSACGSSGAEESGKNESAAEKAIVSAVVEEPLTGAHVRVTVDQTDNVSVRYFPYAF